MVSEDNTNHYLVYLAGLVNVTQKQGLQTSGNSSKVINETMLSLLILSRVNAHHNTQTGQVDTTTEKLPKIKLKKASEIQ